MKRLLLILPIVFASACVDKLDIETLTSVDTDKALRTSADVEGLLVGAYDALGDPDLLGGNLQRDSELMGDAGEIFWDGTFVAPGEIYNKAMLITNDQARATWLDGYYCISICNQVIKNLNLVTEDRKERVEAEARFIRGLVYFELVKVYARTYTDGNPAQNPGVPIVTEESDQFAKIPRSTVQAVYDLVLSDLTFAATNLPATNNFFATTYAARAILSRVYLMQNNYSNALTNANAVLQNTGFTLTADFDDAFNKTCLQGTDRSKNGNATKEDVFAIQITTQDGTNNLNTFFADALFGGRGEIYIDPPHFALYEDGDERAGLFFDDTYTAKFNNQFGNVPIVRLAEMYLTRAECNFRLGSSVGASPLADINTIRERADLPPLTTISSLSQILRERRLELAFEGHLLHDLKRTQSSVGPLYFDNPSLIFPIPQREILINPDLEQNEAYTNN